MNYIVLDLEWNQCPYGKEHEDPTLPFEIVEIGAVRVSGNGEMDADFHENVCPTLYTRLHHITRKVIHISEKDLAGCRTFPEVFADFISWCGENPVFCTWGPGDLTELQRNVRWHMNRGTITGAWPFPYPLCFVDLQKIFAWYYGEDHTRRSLKNAVEYLHIHESEQFHDAFSDAHYTALVMKKLPADLFEKYYSIDTYITPTSREDEIFVNYGPYTKFISMPFDDRNDVMQDKVVSSMRCCVCNRKTRRKLFWFSENGRNMLCASICPEHGLLKGKARIRQNRNGKWYCVKTIRRITSAEYDVLKKKKAAIREKRRHRGD